MGNLVLRWLRPAQASRYERDDPMKNVVARYLPGRSNVLEAKSDSIIDWAVLTPMLAISLSVSIFSLKFGLVSQTFLLTSQVAAFSWGFHRQGLTREGWRFTPLEPAFVAVALHLRAVPSAFKFQMLSAAACFRL